MRRESAAGDVALMIEMATAAARHDLKVEREKTAAMLRMLATKDTLIDHLQAQVARLQDELNRRHTEHTDN